MKKIIIIGCGGIGSRYLEGILLSKYTCEITVVDKSKSSINLAKKMIEASKFNLKQYKINWQYSLDKNFNFFDLAIIATTSKDRALISKKLSKIAIVDYWIFEKVLTQTKKDLNILKKITNNSKGAWVNLPRRIMKWYQKIKKKLNGLQPFHITKIGGLWGLCSNSIHWIDLVSWWSGENLISINTDKLELNWFESKRSGYYENTGEITLNFSRGSKLILKSDKKIKVNQILIKNIKKDKLICKVDLIRNIAKFNDKIIINGKAEFQSQLTGPLISKILNDGNCDLPKLSTAIKDYEIFLNGLLKNWTLFDNKNTKNLPIT